MALVEISQLDVSFRGTEANNIFLEPVFFDDDLRGQFRVLGNVANKKKMVFVQDLENIVRKYSGCGFNPVGSVDIYQRTIDVEKMKVDLEMCWDEFEDTVFEELLKTGTRLPDVSGTLIENILLHGASPGRPNHTGRGGIRRVPGDPRRQLAGDRLWQCALHGFLGQFLYRGVPGPRPELLS